MNNICPYPDDLLFYAYFGAIGSFVGLAGYLPLYLQKIGWTSVHFIFQAGLCFLCIIPVFFYEKETGI